MWSNDVARDRLVTARRLRETTDPCSWERHFAQPGPGRDLPWLIQNVLAKQIIVICVDCGRTPYEVLDAEIEGPTRAAVAAVAERVMAERVKVPA